MLTKDEGPGITEDEAPNSKRQAPEKIQIPKSKFQVSSAEDEGATRLRTKRPRDEGKKLKC
jgi:hypothetical protein